MLGTTTHTDINSRELRKLSPTVSYSIRKLLHQYRDALESVFVRGAASEADPFCDLNYVLETLYLEEEEIKNRVQQLEFLCQCHQKLSERGEQYQRELVRLRQEIFWILGFKVKSMVA